MGRGVIKISEESKHLDNLLPKHIVSAERGFNISEQVGMRAAEVKFLF